MMIRTINVNHVVTFDATPRLLEALQSISGSGETASLLREIMSQLSDLNAELKAALAAASDRIKADFDALMAKVTTGTITDAEVSDFRDSLSLINAIDPDPSNPPVEPPPIEPPVEPPV